MGNIRHQTLRPDVRLLHLSLSCSLFIVSSLHYLLGLNYYYVWSFGRCRGQPCSWCTHTHLLVGFYRWQRPEPRDGWLSGCDILNLLPLSGCLFEFSSQLYQTRGGNSLELQQQEYKYYWESLRDMKCSFNYNIDTSSSVPTYMWMQDDLSTLYAHDFLFNLVYTSLNQMCTLYHTWYDMFG